MPELLCEQWIWEGQGNLGYELISLVITKSSHFPRVAVPMFLEKHILHLLFQNFSKFQNAC